MYFFSLLLFFFFSAQSSSNRLEIDRDVSNPYGGISYPARIESKIKVCFNFPQFSKNDWMIEINSSENIESVFNEKNGLNKIIALKSTHIPQRSAVYLEIPLITDIHPSKCSIFESRRAIDLVEKIKELNAINAFEIEGKSISDPFRLTENINAYKEYHSENIFIKSYYYSLLLSVAATLIMIALPTKRISSLIPVLAFFPPFLCNFKYIKDFIKNFPDIENLGLSGCKKNITVTSFFFVLPTILIYGTNIGLNKIKDAFW